MYIYICIYVYKSIYYFGTAETAFKLRYSNHQRSFKFLKYKTDLNYPTMYGK